MSFRTKLTLLLLAIVLSTAIMVEYIVYTFSAEQLKMETMHQLRGRVAQTLDYVDRLMFRRSRDALDLASDRTLHDSLADPSAVTRRLKEFLDLHVTHVSYAFFNTDGVRVADTDGLHLGEKLMRAGWIEALVSGEDGDVRIEIGFDEDLKSPALYFLASAKGDSGKPLGVVMGKTPVSHFEIMTDPLLRIDPKLRIDLVDRSGRLIYSSYNPKAALRERAKIWPLIEKQIAKPAAIPDAIAHQGVLYVFAKERGVSGPAGPYPGNGWTLILGLPEEVALIPARDLRQKLAGVFGIVLVVSALAAWYVLRGITRPLLGLQRAVVDLSQGTFGTIAEPRSRDEIGRLTEAFNTMSLRLRDTTVSRDYIAGLIRQMGEALIVTDPAGRIRTVNPVALQILGYTEAELIGQSIEGLFTEEDLPKGLPGPRPTEVHETTWRTKHDQHIPVLLTSADLRDRQNTVEGRIYLGQDISERKQLEAERERLNNRWRSILESAGEGIAGVDTEGRFIFINRAGAAIHGFTPEEMVGRD